MDPNATLKRIIELYNESQVHFGTDRGNDAGEDLDTACHDLLSWIARGGFEPNWEDCPSAVKSYLSCCQIDFAKQQVL